MKRNKFKVVDTGVTKQNLDQPKVKQPKLVIEDNIEMSPSDIPDPHHRTYASLDIDIQQCICNSDPTVELKSVQEWKKIAQFSRSPACPKKIPLYSLVQKSGFLYAAKLYKVICSHQRKRDTFNKYKYSQYLKNIARRETCLQLMLFVRKTDFPEQEKKDFLVEMVNQFDCLDWKDIPPTGNQLSPVFQMTDNVVSNITRIDSSLPVNQLETKTLQEALGNETKEFTLKHPIVLIKGMASAVDLNLHLFDTENIKKNHPSQMVEIRKQAKNQLGWHFRSEKQRKMKLQAFANHQSNFKGEAENILFATNIDFDSSWASELEELHKLPPFLMLDQRNVDNTGYISMLSYVDEILGMSTPQLFMKVKGSSTSGNQENNNFCSVNINMGPENCEWYGVSDEHWENIEALCQSNEPGDLIFVNIGCVHWVRALGRCNNVAWNIGPLTKKQYEKALERYEYNKLRKFKSLVPMVLLSWNLLAKVDDYDLLGPIMNLLVKTLDKLQDDLSYIRLKEVPAASFDLLYGVYYCDSCNGELYNLFLVLKRRKNKLCLDCAKNVNEDLTGFTYFQKSKLEDLWEKLNKNY